jgi:O-antigen ligase
VLVAAVVVIAFTLSGIHVRLDDGRELSIMQLRANASSVFTQAAAGDHSTAGWRLAFWNDIIDDTVHGPRFWTGNGFGVNLADEYGYQANEDGSLRSPHDISMTVLGRMGVPGLALWITLNLVYAQTMFVGFRRARRIRDDLLAAVFLLLLAWWAAVMVNASFDPYLEGPQGAIPFWTSIGIGLAAARSLRRDHEGTTLRTTTTTSL